MKKIILTAVVLILIFIVMWTLKPYNKSMNTKNTNEPQEYTLKVAQTVTIANAVGGALKFTLDSVDAPKNTAPGSRPFYRLTVAQGAQSKKVLFDSNESGQFFTYFGSTVKISIVTNSTDLKIRLVETVGKHLIVSQSLPGDNPAVTTKIATITFDSTNHATLSIEKSTTGDVEGLMAAWDDIQKTPELIWKYDNIVGEERRLVGKTSKPGDEDYIYALKSTLERKYGFWVDIEK